MHKHSLTWLAIFAVMALMFLRLPQMVARQDAVLNTYSALVEVDALARQKFVEPIEDERLVHGAIRGIMLQLDPYSGYIAPDELPWFERRNHGEYIGVGLEVGVQKGRLTVIAPIEGGPAAEAGIRCQDVILSIDGQDVDGLSVLDVEERLSPPKAGATVRLRVLHPGESEPEVLTITRGPVSLWTVKGFGRDAAGHWDYMIDPKRGIGYIRVSSFLDNTTRDFDAALGSLLDRDVCGLVLDLRFNPGGMMHQAVAMVDRFVNSGLIVATVTRRRAVREYRATARGTVTDVELAVLINGGSASASEIVAGSLQAHDRAVVVGERSFGKGSVQQLIYLKEHKAAIKLTTAYYRLPDGRIIHRTPKNVDTDAWGVKPDIHVSLVNEEMSAARQTEGGLPGLDSQLREALSRLCKKIDARS
jgi:carboxyl-terminal processing protease